MASHSPIPRIARASSTGSSAGPARAARRPERQDDDPDAVVERILAHLREDHYGAASRLAAEAAVRFPDHERVQWAWNIFDTRGKATVSELGPQPGWDEEIEWLRSPPEWAQGKWVALLGREVVAVGETFKEVVAAVHSQDLPKRPLVHRIG